MTEQPNSFLEGIQNVIKWAEFNHELKAAVDSGEGIVLDSQQVKAVAFGISTLAQVAKESGLLDRP